MRWLTFGAAVVVAAFCHLAQAANTIDPNNVGATDVVLDPFGTPVTLTNPLSDPLLLPGEFLGVGNTDNGELRIDNGSVVSNHSGVLYVGIAGSGSLRVESGGQVSDNVGILGLNPGSTGEATISGLGSQWNIAGGRLYLGYLGGSGTLRVEAGGQVSSYGGTLGLTQGATGAASITGTGSQWNNRHSLVVGDDGSGTLTVADGGQVTTGTLYASLDDLHGDGTITATEGAVLDADLQFDATQGTQAVTSFGSGGTLSVNAAGGELGAGYKGTGSLTVAEGIAIGSRDGYLGYHPGSTGAATISGTGSKWTTVSLEVGRYGSGTLRVEAGGQVSGLGGYLGFLPGTTGAATITGPGSQWNNSRELYVGFFGNGTLRVEAGGQVSGYESYLGGLPGSTGAATITGPGSQWNSGFLDVGFAGSGTLSIADGGLVSSSYGSLGSGTGSTGEVTITGSGSQWNSGGDLLVGRHGSGTLSIANGGLVSVAEALTIDDDTDGDSFVNMASGGMLALQGEADGSLTEFLDLIEGTDAIRYRDHRLAPWEPITAATEDVDYTLDYLPNGDLAGYTMLTVGMVPEAALLEIKPGSDPNPVNLKSKGVLPVAILGSDELDVLDIDLDSLLFGDPLLVENGGSPVSPLRYSFEDVTDDGLVDLSLKFSMRDLVDLEAIGADTVEALLVGEFLDGMQFEGLDSIRIIPSKGIGSRTLVTIPEPATALLACVALCILASIKRRWCIMSWLGGVRITFWWATSAVGVVVALSTCGLVHAQFSNLHDFNGTDGFVPRYIAQAGSTIYGTTFWGGANSQGTLWSYDTSSDSFTNLHDFSSVADGTVPSGIALSGSTIYGTAGSGGAHFDGTLWSYDTSSGDFANLHDFSGAADGAALIGGIALSGSTIYGTANRGGANDYGTLWSYDTSSGDFANLHDFSSGADGSHPFDIALAGSTIYGTARYSGANDDGTLWSYDTSSGDFANLHDFSSGADGAGPADIALAGSTIYGTASSGGANDDGTLWSYATSSGDFTKLHNFSDAADGELPYGITLSGSTIYGTAWEGGANNEGTLWSYATSSGDFTKLHNFSDAADGELPYGIALSGSTIYGTAYYGGAHGAGTLWSYTIPEPATALLACVALGILAGVVRRRCALRWLGGVRITCLWATFAVGVVVALSTCGLVHAQFSNLHDFSSAADGWVPVSIALSGSTIYGTAQGGGANGVGTLWSYDTNSDSFNNLHDFSGAADGENPFGMALSESTIYGTAWYGGANTHGTLWSYDTSSGDFANRHDFSGAADGYNPTIIALSGSTIYGTAQYGGANGDGTLWSYDTLSGGFTNVHDFSRTADGESPLVIALSGSTIYGTAHDGGANDHGTLWSYDTGSDSFTTLHDFSRAADGQAPTGIALSGSTIYGTAEVGGAHDDGTLWSYDTLSGDFANLHDFSSAADGRNALVNALSGSTIYGTAGYGGAHDEGTLWSYDTGSDSFTTLHDFGSAADGANPFWLALSESTIYGTAAVGGANGSGTLWSYTIPEPATALLACVALGLLASVQRRWC